MKNVKKTISKSWARNEICWKHATQVYVWRQLKKGSQRNCSAGLLNQMKTQCVAIRSILTLLEISLSCTGAVYSAASKLSTEQDLHSPTLSTLGASYIESASRQDAILASWMTRLRNLCFLLSIKHEIPTKRIISKPQVIHHFKLWVKGFQQKQK